MAFSIVADSDPASGRPDIGKSSRWCCDVFSGTADALIEGGIITREQLEPQRGRRPGVTVFLASGEPCQTNRRAWREPGYQAIRRQDDGTYEVEVTVSKDVQAWRRKADAAAAHEREQQRIVKAIAEGANKYRNWNLQHDYSGWAETWEGTKGQLQAFGIGAGLKFPGEPGGPKEDLNCKCPLGFDVRVYLPTYDRAKAEAGIYSAQSRYVSSRERRKEYVAHAPGVLLEVWSEWGTTTDTYVGTAAALIDANLVPSLAHFPGQPGANKVRASYRKDWTPCTTANRQEWGATIMAKGKGRFAVDVPVSKAESARRKSLVDAKEAADNELAKVRADERRELRQLAESIGTSSDDFRRHSTRRVDLWLDMLQSVFAEPAGALRFDIVEGSNLASGLTEAFAAIRRAVQTAEVVRDTRLDAEIRTRLKMAEATDIKEPGLSRRDTKPLRLVHSSRDCR